MSDNKSKDPRQSALQKLQEQASKEHQKKVDDAVKEAVSAHTAFQSALQKLEDVCAESSEAEERLAAFKKAIS